MRILKDNKILTNYILPILMLPVVSLILEIGIKFLFQIGNYFGTFMRGLYELVLRNI